MKSTFTRNAPDNLGRNYCSTDIAMVFTNLGKSKNKVILHAHINWLKSQNT